jgi:methionine aminopeptidase
MISKVSVGGCIHSLCKAGDEMMIEELAKVHNKKRTEKGIAFPTCLSVNEVAGHHSPLDSVLLKEGDMVKIDLGVHIDGYVGMAAHTIQLGKGHPKADDLLVAAHAAI